MLAYYNENDPAAAHVLRCLISDGLIAPGNVDDRSIKDVKPDDLRGYTQCHFFAGMGGWSVAARLAGWPDARPLWTASCPCQPFSAAGKGTGTDDPRHLWPDLYRIVSGARERGFGPDCIVGEQVSGAAGYGWFDGVRADLAAQGFACGTRDIPACAIDAPHQRNRLYWGAVADGDGARPLSSAYAGIHRETQGQWPRDVEPKRLPGDGLHADADKPFGRLGDEQPARQLPVDERDAGSRLRPGSRNGRFWSDAEWLACHDGKARRAKPGIRLLAHGVVGRIDWWRLAGNGIVLPLAAEVLAALMDVLDEWREAA